MWIAAYSTLLPPIYHSTAFYDKNVAKMTNHESFEILLGAASKPNRRLTGGSARFRAVAIV